MCNTYLPCPFCGRPPETSIHKDESLWSHEIVDWYYVYCTECDIGMNECNDEEELVERWNRRKE